MPGEVVVSYTLQPIRIIFKLHTHIHTDKETETEYYQIVNVCLSVA